MKVQSVVNIGLSTAELKGSGQMEVQHVMDVLRAEGIKTLHGSVHVSDSEPTLVVELPAPLEPVAAERLSSLLHQEAIAERFADGSGTLHGPMADRWGPYNPAFFVMPDGSRAG